MHCKFLSVVVRNLRKIPMRAVLAFLVTLALCLSLVSVMIINRSRVERLVSEQLILEKSGKVSSVLLGLLYKTQLLSSLLMINGGEVVNFEEMAAIIVDDPAILNILIAPGGVVSQVYPMEGNEAVIGLDFFAEGAGNKEAVMAKETGTLVLGGPFQAVQGGQILVGRLPVFTDNPGGTRSFWGLVSVTLRYPEALEGAGLNELEIQGYKYEIWRVNPDTNEKQVISDGGHSEAENYIEKAMPIANAEWHFRVFPVRTWSGFPETWISLFLSLCVSSLAAFVTQNNHALRKMQEELKTLSTKDHLTGIYNRRYFIESVIKQMNRVLRAGGETFLILFDLDFFKKVNDQYGHHAGDAVLKEVTARVKKTLRSYDLFARYGGEEFIIFVTDIDQEHVIQLAERIRTNVGDTPVLFNGESIAVTISLGLTPGVSTSKLEATIDRADCALYQAKKEGRNRSVFYGAEGIFSHAARKGK